VRPLASTLVVCAALAAWAWPSLSSVPETLEPPAPYSAELRWTPPEHRHRLQVGALTLLEITIWTPPDHTLLPFPHAELQGLRLVSRVPMPIARGEEMWAHRTRVALQTLAEGDAVWPALTLVVEDAAGQPHEITTPEQVRTVHSALARHPGRTRPFGLRYPVRHRELPTLTVALGLTLAASLLAWAGLRRRAAGAGARVQPPTPEPEGDARSRAEAALKRARSLLERDAREASNAGAALLREFMAERFDPSLRAATTAELRSAPPSDAARPYWQPFVQLLGRYDADRFQGPSDTQDDGPPTKRVAECLDETARFLSSCESGAGERTQ